MKKYLHPVTLFVTLIAANTWAAVTEYDRLIPYYASYCVSSRYETKNAHKVGGHYAHATVYIKGLCKDPSAPLPQLMHCPPSMNIHDANTGVGVSLTWDLKNVEYVAVDGKDFFFNGLLTGPRAQEPVSKDLWEETIQKSIDLGIFDGVEAHVKPMGIPVTSSPAQITKKLAGKSMLSNFSLSYGKTTYCVNIPLTRAMVDETKEYLNQINHRYRPGLFDPNAVVKSSGDFHWDPLAHNCGHLPFNLFADLSFIDPRPEDKNYLMQLSAPVMPANLFIDLAHLSNDKSFDAYKLYKDKKILAYFNRHKRLPTYHGSTIEIHPFKKTNNQMFVDRPDFSFWHLLNGFTQPESKTGDFQKLLADPTKNSLKQNLLAFKARYENTLNDIAAKKQLPLLGKRNEKNFPLYKKFFQEFEVYIQQSLLEVNQMLDQLN